MSDPVLPSPDDAAPIDAEFEPVQKKPQKTTKRQGPGWFSFFVLSGITILALGLSVLTSGLFSDNAQTAQDPQVKRLEALEASLNPLSQSQTDLSAKLQTNVQDTADLKDRLDELSTQTTDFQGSLEILENDLADISAAQAAVPAPLPLSELSRLNTRLNALERQQQGLANNTGDTLPPVIADQDLLMTRLRDAELELDRLRDEVTTLRGDLGSLIDAQDQARTDEIEAGQMADAAIALSTIETAARRGQPFQTGFSDLRKAAPNLQGLADLEGLAASGAPTLSDLRDAFTPLKREAIRLEASTKGTTSSILNSLFGDGVRVRRQGETTVSDTLQTAETALVTGDLAGALSTLNTLPEHVQPVFTDWRLDAQNRLILEDSLDRLRLAMIAKDRP